MNYKIYAIKSLKYDRIYVGMSKNVKKRLKEHNNGSVFSTKGYHPWKIIFLENCGNDRKKARKREKYFKAGFGKEILKSIKTS